MKTNIIIITLLLFLTAGCGIKEMTNQAKELAQAFEKVHIKTNYILTYNVTLSELENKPISIKVHAPIELRATSGLIALESYYALTESELSYDRYIIKDVNDERIASFKHKDLELISKSHKTGIKALEYLQSQNINELTKILDSTKFNKEAIELTMETFEQNLSNKEVKFKGFEISEENGVMYCLILFSLDNSHASFTYSITDNPNIILGISF
jgi:hypothetical protein